VTALALVLTAAFILGLRHATDADHLAAVSTIVARSQSFRSAVLVGVWWGVGHSATILLVGGGIVAFDLVLPDRLATTFEACVALMLIALGVRNLLHRNHRVARAAVPSLMVGVMHGLAGSAAVILLIVPVLREPAWAATYLLTFGVGTVIGMAALTCAMAGSMVYLARRATSFDRWVRLGAGAISVVFGAVLLYRIA
jgi:hypothetical protein